jgi:hypothetical protein
MLASHCHGDDRPDCPILDDLAHHGHEHKHCLRRTRTTAAAKAAAF